jgi:hypothetical protein
MIHHPGKGTRSNAYSASKFTNWRAFQPWFSAMDKAVRTHRHEFPEGSGAPLVVVAEPHPDFVCPVTEAELKEVLASIPRTFTAGLKAVFVLAGSKKLAKVSRRLFCYGAYSMDCVCLTPHPKAYMQQILRRPPSPSLLRELERAGVDTQESRKGLVITFDLPSLRRFYLQDVLMHEIGHHVDRRPRASRRTREGFASWFASEYGYRLRQDV